MNLIIEFVKIRYIKKSRVDFLTIINGKMDLHLYDAVSDELYTDIYLMFFTNQ